MITDTNNQLILNLAAKLTKKQISAKEVKESLARICEHFSFNSGMVYEVDQHKCLNLAECTNPDDILIPKEIYLENISPAKYQRLAEDAVTYLSTEGASAEDKKILELFDADSMVIVSVTDSELQIFGLLVCIRTQKKEHISTEQLESISIALHLLGKYLDARILGRKALFTHTSLNSILDHTGIDIYVNDFYTHEILYVNESMARPYGGVDAFFEQKCWQILFPGQTGPCEFCPQKKLIDENGEPTNIYSWDYQRAFDGAWFRVFSAAFQWIDGRLAHVVSSADITDNKEKEATIEYLAHYDVLTGLPNRRMLVNDCKNRITNATVDEQGYLLFFDIDGFKAINDNYGHDAGDEFLIKLGEFFKGIPLLKDSVYRNGGDEFVAIIGYITKPQVKNLGNFIHARFQKPWSLKNGDVYCNTSIGVACYPEDGDNAEDLLSIADQAMYHVKKSGGGSICFGYEIREELRKHSVNKQK